MVDTEIARANMIEQQIRAWNVLATQTLHALASIRREDFVPAESREIAFVDMQIPLPCGEVMLEPKVSARMLEALRLTPESRALEIGGGCGYLTALMASLCASVDSVEIHAELNAMAKRNLGMAGIDNVKLFIGDAHAGAAQIVGDEKYDAILISASCAKIPEAFFEQLADDGNLVGIEGDAPAMQAVRYAKSDARVRRETLFETHAPRLRNVSEPPVFSF